MTTPKKKLIEVALPLEAINKASAREKSIRHGHPSTMHLWWARRPLAAARAVIFSQMVNDPSAHPDLFPTAKAQEKERQRLFAIIEDLVQWDNSTNEKVLQAARDEIWHSWRAACAEYVDHPLAKTLFDRRKLPGFHDPFAGGGALPWAAQGLGLEAHATDLNPVAVLINKAMIEVPRRFAGQPPLNPAARKGLAKSGSWTGAKGLAEDIRYYGHWMREEACKRIGHLYPKVEITTEVARDRKDLKPLAGKKLPVIAWLWARTVRSPNPAFARVDVPLASTFVLSTKAGRETFVEPMIDGADYQFTVRVGKGRGLEKAKNGTKSGGSHSSFLCLMSGTPMPFEYLRDEAKAGRMGQRLMAIVAEGERGRVYLPPTAQMEAVALNAKPEWKPEVEICHWPGRTNVVEYGMTHFGDLFTPRQLVGLGTLAGLVQEVRETVAKDAASGFTSDDARSLAEGGAGLQAYADAVALYLGIAVDKAADYNSTICGWIAGGETLRNTFGRQAIPMVWDYCETNTLGASSGSILSGYEQVSKAVETYGVGPEGHAHQGDAQRIDVCGRVVSTDPPYYDNIGYADLSDYFYVWLRRALRPVFPDLFSTVAVPKAEELVATPYRHGTKEKAEAFFLGGMTEAMSRLAASAHPAFPVTIYYAFKQSESDGDNGVTSTGWDTFLDAVLKAGFAITGTWPMRTERGARAIGIGSNALASSIVLVCRKRATTATPATRREFISALRSELPAALAHLQRGNIAPVDLAQAAIGPGMAVFTRYSQVLDSGGDPVSVRDALALINQTLDEALAEQEGDFDADSRWALAWFEQSGFAEGEYGVAETLSKAKNTSVRGLEEAGILKSSRGKVRLLKTTELAADWDPNADPRLTAWEVVHHLIRALEQGGELGAAALLAKLGAKAEPARELAYRLYTICERKKRAAEALAYNGLVKSWPEISRLAREGGTSMPGAQGGLFDKDEE
jgi:putative DNA methylase